MIVDNIKAVVPCVGVDVRNGTLTGNNSMTLQAGHQDKRIARVAVPYTLQIRSGCAGGGREH